MAKIRHISIQCDDPESLADFYKEVFGLKEMRRIGLEDRGQGAIYLSDGVVSFELIRITDPDFPNFRPMGLNHVGFVVSDLDECVAKAEANGAVTVKKCEEVVPGQLWEYKMRDPAGIDLDIYDVQGRGWPGISNLEEYGIHGETTAEDHAAGNPLAKAEATTRSED